MVNIIISSDPRYRISRMAIKEAVLGVLARHRVSGKVELEVNIVGDRKMHELNRKYRQIDATIDVLTFALEDPLGPPVGGLSKLLPGGFIASPDRVLRLGSIVISYPQAIADAASDNIPLEEEVKFLVTHGTNHLLGIHHD